MKRILSLVLAVMLLLFAVPAPADGAEATVWRSAFPRMSLRRSVPISANNSPVKNESRSPASGRRFRAVRKLFVFVPDIHSESRNTGRFRRKQHPGIDPDKMEFNDF